MSLRPRTGLRGNHDVEEADMLLEDKNAVIYGGGGSIGGAVARAFAREGASVFLAGRTEATLEQVAEDIRAAGGARKLPRSMRSTSRRSIGMPTRCREGGQIDISFNLITHPHTHGVPLAEMSVDDFMAPVEVAARTTFITARAAARQMIPRRSGVILAFGGPGDRSGPSSRLLPGRDAGRLRRDRDDAAAALGRAGPARNPVRHAGQRRRAGDAPGRLRRRGSRSSR